MNLIKSVIIYGAVGAGLYGLLKYFTPDMETKNMVILILIILAIILILNTQCAYINEGFSNMGDGNKMPVGNTFDARNKMGRFDNTAGSDTMYSDLPVRPQRYVVPPPNYSDDGAYQVDGDINNLSNNIYYDPEDGPEVNKDVEDMKDLMGIDRERWAILRENVNNAKARIASRWQDEMKYTQSNPLNTIPLGANLDKGYTMLDPIQWFRAWDRPPVCRTDKQCPVCPVAPSGTDEYLQFDARDNITGPENIDVSYVRNIQPRKTQN